MKKKHIHIAMPQSLKTKILRILAKKSGSENQRNRQNVAAKAEIFTIDALMTSAKEVVKKEKTAQFEKTVVFSFTISAENLAKINIFLYQNGGVKSFSDVVRNLIEGLK